MCMCHCATETYKQVLMTLTKTMFTVNGMAQINFFGHCRDYFHFFLSRTQTDRLLKFLVFAGVDPMHEDSYRRSSKFLAYLNNQTSNADHVADSIQWKNNFLRVKKLVLIGGPDDGTINPWQSAHFGYWRQCDKGLDVIVPMREQNVYLEDSFGLKTLDGQSRIVITTVPNTNHTMMHRSQAVVNSAVIPHLV
jgi:hypothetical protein